MDQDPLAVLDHEASARREFVALDPRERHLEQRVPVVGVGLERDAVPAGLQLAVPAGLQLAEQAEAGGQGADIPIGDQEMVGSVDGLEQFLQRSFRIGVGELGEVLDDEDHLAGHGFIRDQIQHVLGELAGVGRAIE